jgi:hypothetical protein
MQRAEFELDDGQLRFLNDYRHYGFDDPSSMVRAALNLLKKGLDLQRLKQSADLYAELYAEDADIRALAETRISG